MRRILLFTRFGLSAITSAAMRATTVALTAGMIIATGTSQTQAQYPVPYTASAAGDYNGQANKGSLFGPSVVSLGEAPVSSKTRSNVVDSAFRGSTDSRVASASYSGGGYYASEDYAGLRAADCNAGYGIDASCNISWYVNAEALAFRREGNRRFSLTQNTFMNNVDYEFGGRVTAGRMFDCVNAVEFVYAGPFRWTRFSDVSGAGTINSRFSATPTTLADAFNGANRHRQVLLADLNNFEVNRRWWAWDAISTLIGVRYVKYEEDYQLTSFRGAVPTSGSFRDKITNDMVGLQIGGDVFFPTSLLTMVSLKGKAGAYANFASREMRLVDSSGTALVNGADDVNIAGLIELGANVHYQLMPSVRLTSGYEVWYLPGIATESGQRPNILNSSSATIVDSDDDVVFHGFTFGAQLLY